MLVVTLERLPDVGLVGHEDQVRDPVVCFNNNLGGCSSTTKEFGLDFGVEFFGSSKKRATQVVGRHTVEVDTIGDAVIND